MRCIGDHKTRVVEGETRAKEFAEYLTRMNCTKHVWISEDATVITSKVTYDPNTNQLVGLVLPIDLITGCPKAFTFIASNAECIKQHLMKAKSSVVYVVMAQPLNEKVPPFLLQMFGSDNKIHTTDILKRWKHTSTELEK